MDAIRVVCVACALSWVIVGGVSAVERPAETDASGRVVRTADGRHITYDTEATKATSTVRVAPKARVTARMYSSIPTGTDLISIVAAMCASATAP